VLNIAMQLSFATAFIGRVHIESMYHLAARCCCGVVVTQHACTSTSASPPRARPRGRAGACSALCAHPVMSYDR
jgi:hypothetical protein